MIDHDFEALRAERNRSVRESMQRLAYEEQVPLESLRTNYAWDACYCACSTGGPCEHRWDATHPCGWTPACSHCAEAKHTHDVHARQPMGIFSGDQDD